MKASRLLQMLLLLQTRQRLTTRELAERLEVSRRTILRDVEALSAAGVPVYAERGRNGGILLLSTARLNASHLDPSELEALSVVGLDAQLLEKLGLTTVHAAAVRKIDARVAAMPAARTVARLADLIVVDSSAWFVEPKATVDVAELAEALRSRRRIRLHYRRNAETLPSWREADPYGLAVKSGRWYLVADVDADSRLFSLERITSYEVLDAPAALRDGETLRTVWAGLRDRTESPGRVSVTFRLRENRLDLARRIIGARIHTVSPADDGWRTVIVRYPELESVRQLLQFGDHIEITSPDEARERVRQLATDLAQRHTQRDTPEV
ncbi:MULTISPECIES: YafY family protein [unclassified Rathayibacter]|uniref:helix-turn-helix transcriptional regulator n=1 Tax=unclassified Rathayibacter TaxID=2609250 RepID=UPI000CE8EE52|nr:MULTISPECIES: WYL domain-containing protein [unclassified Rathayibacter]PPG94373.1 transcriptional regulator [Rathayibacter sp. AY1G9]PPH95235.1 transcriptional regulator [Rathayibacter sp. AY1D1]PPI26951.1 transcriptional regulator [Rathayibacter sp. AY1B5]